MPVKQKQKVECVEPLEETRQNALRQAMHASRDCDPNVAHTWLMVAAEAERQKRGYC